jgi:autotransporter-associated beta strand protein
MKTRSSIVIVAVTMVFPVLLHAQTTINFTGGADGSNGNMITTTNWSPAQAPSATTDLVIASRNGTGTIPTLFTGGNYSIRSITADNSAGQFSSTFGLRIVSSTVETSVIERTISFPEGGIPIWTARNNATLRFQKNSFLAATSILNLDLNYTGFAQVDVDATSTIRVLSANIRGTGGLEKTGPGTFSIEQAGTYTGGVRILEGVLSVSTTGGLGAAPAEFVPNQVFINGGTLRFDNVALASSSTRGFEIGSNGGGIEVLNSAASILGAISGSGQLTKSGGFILGLNAENTYSGGTVISQGRVTFNNPASFGSGSITMQADTGIYTTISGTEIANDILIAGGNRFGNSAATVQSYNGAISLGGETRSVRISSQVTWGGEVADGGLTLEIDPSARLILNGDNSYTGPTQVTSGILTINGTQASSSTTISAGAVLEGAGTLAGLTTIEGGLSIGNSIGTMTFEDLQLNASSIATFEILGGDTVADMGNVSGSLDLGGATLDLVQLGTYTVGDKFTLFSYVSLSGTFAGLADGDTFAAADGFWNINYFDDTAGLNGGTGSAFVTITAIPEPRAALLGAFGLILLLGGRRRAGL